MFSLNEERKTVSIEARTKTLENRYSVEKAIAHINEHSFSWETFNLVVQLNANCISAYIYLHEVYTYTRIRVGILRYKFPEVVLDIADQRS